MDKESIKKFKKYNLRFYLIIVAVIFLVYPKLILMHSNMNFIIFLFLWTGVGTVYFSHKFLSSLESVKDSADLNDFFTPQGRAALKKNPKAYLKMVTQSTVRVISIW